MTSNVSLPLASLHCYFSFRFDFTCANINEDNFEKLKRVDIPDVVCVIYVCHLCCNWLVVFSLIFIVSLCMEQSTELFSVKQW